MMMLSAITVYHTDPNLLTAVLSAVLGICAVAFCLVLGIYLLRAAGEKRKLSADEYHREEREEEVEIKVKKHRHSKKKKGTVPKEQEEVQVD